MSPAQAARVKGLKRILASDRPKSKLEIQCTERLIDLHRNAKQLGLVWVEDEAVAACQFFDGLTHWKGRWNKQPLHLQPWQAECLIAPLFGWYRENESNEPGCPPIVRLFRTAYIEIPRKNGKTTLLAGVGLRGLMMDGEPGAEIYAAATKKDQAKIIHKDAKKILGVYKPFIRSLNNSLEFDPLDSVFVPVGADADTLDGLNVHMALLDELHAHKSRGVYDVMISGMGARANPLLAAITTAGIDRSSICWEQREMIRQIVEGDLDLLSAFGWVSTIDEGDDWEDPMVWHKANPNLYTIIPESYLRDRAKAAKFSGAAQNDFRRKHLDEWVGQAIRWIDQKKWDSIVGGPFDDELLRELPCWVAVDLADSRDTNAVTLLFKSSAGWLSRTIFYAPEEAISDRAERDRRQVRQWMDRGLVVGLPGELVDRGHLAYLVSELIEPFKIQAFAYDPWHSDEFISEMTKTHGLPESKLVKFRQTAGHYAAPSRSFEELIYNGKLTPERQPCMRWQIGNLAASVSAEGNKKPDKAKSADKIDGPVSLIMAIGEAMHGESGPPEYQGGILIDV